MPLLSQACSKLLRRHLPSIAISRPPDSATRADIHATKHRSNASGLSRAKSPPKVSWLGMPSGRSRNVASHARFALPNCAACTHPSAPQMTAITAVTIMS
jgi:hypothetical protein